MRKRSRLKTPLMLGLLLLAAGCASREQAFGNLYEGVKSRETLQTPSSEPRPPEQSLSRQQYEAERKRLQTQPAP